MRRETPRAVRVAPSARGSARRGRCAPRARVPSSRSRSRVICTTTSCPGSSRSVIEAPGLPVGQVRDVQEAGLALAQLDEGGPDRLLDVLYPTAVDVAGGRALADRPRRRAPPPARPRAGRCGPPPDPIALTSRIFSTGWAGSSAGPPARRPPARRPPPAGPRGRRRDLPAPDLPARRTPSVGAFRLRGRAGFPSGPLAGALPGCRRLLGLTGGCRLPAAPAPGPRRLLRLRLVGRRGRARGRLGGGTGAAATPPDGLRGRRSSLPVPAAFTAGTGCRRLSRLGLFRTHVRRLPPPGGAASPRPEVSATARAGPSPPASASRAPRPCGPRTEAGAERAA